MTEKIIAENIKKLKGSIAQTAGCCGRNAGDVRLVLVTKTVPVERVREAYDAGVRDFGENRMQEFLEKHEALPEDIVWHFIGHLQTNKVKYLIREAVARHKVGVLVHALDREELAVEIDRQSRERDVPEVRCLVQVNTSGEISKGGFAPGQVAGFLAGLKPDSRLRMLGLMTIGPLTEDREQTRRAFRGLRELRDRLQRDFPQYDLGILSMGMSDDYEIAIEEGANLLRIGSAVFGSRGTK